MDNSIKIFFLIFLLFFIEKECFSQNVPLTKVPNQNEIQKTFPKALKSNYLGFIFDLNYSYWYHNSLSFNILHGYYDTYGGRSGGIGANIALIGNDIIISPQIVGQVNIMFLTTRATLMYMTDFKQRGDIVFNPQIGLGWQAASITFGYNFVIDKQYGRTPSDFTLNVQVGLSPKGKLVEGYSY